MIARFRAPTLAIAAVVLAASLFAAGLCQPDIELALATIPTPTWTGTPTPTPGPPNTWAPGPVMPLPRAAHQAVTLNDGQILITGGVNPQFQTDLPLRFIPWQHQFEDAYTTGGGVPITRFTDTATRLSWGSVVVTLYDHAGDQDAITQMYIPTHQWGFFGFLQMPRYDHTATLLPDDTVLVIGGQNTSGAVLSTERNNPFVAEWLYDVPSPYERIRHTATMLNNGKLLLSASLDSNMQPVPPQLWDNGVWSAAGTANARWDATATKLLDGRVLVVGGVTNVGGSLVRTDPEIYNPATNTWSPAGVLKREGHTATLLNDGRVLVVGDAPHSTSAMAYNPATNTWVAVAPMSTARGYHSASLLPDGRVLVVGGNTPLGLTAASEYYSPSGFTGATFTPTRTPTPTVTPTSTNTPTPTPTPTRTNTFTPSPTSTPCDGPCPPTDSPTNTPTPIPTSSIQDSDGDGCYDWQEGLNDPAYGGQRNPFFAYDFYDVNGTRKVDGADIGLVRAHYNPSGSVPPGDAIYDRSLGAAAWAPGAPDNKINAVDIGLVRASFNHDCNFPA